MSATGPEPRRGPSSGPSSAPHGGPGTYDPLRLCVYSTVALLAWLTGPYAVAFFAALGLSGYLRARRAGLTRSKCLLRDTRLVIAYLAVILGAATGSIIWHVAR